jgi:hypothetical protein
MAKAWIEIIAACVIVLVCFILKKILAYKNAKDVAEIMYRNENGVHATLYASGLYYDENSKKFFIHGVDKIFEAKDFSRYLITSNKTKGIVYIGDTSHQFNLKGKTAAADFEACCKAIQNA